MRTPASAFVLLAVLLSGCGAAGQERSADGAETEMEEDEPLPAEDARSDTMRVTFIDVGKGDCILIEKDESFVLIDAGYDETASAVVQRLRSEQVVRLDSLILTHYDKDHIGGADEIITAFDVECLYLPDYEGDSRHYAALMEAAKNRAVDVRRVAEDAVFSLAGVDYTIYASDVGYVKEPGKEGNDNDVSLVIAAEYGEDSWLFAGDIEKAGIKSYLAGAHGAFDIVKMPHHGKKEGNTDDFIADVQPKIAVITDSKAAPASDKVLALLNEAGAAVYCTGVSGTVTITGDGKEDFSVLESAVGGR